MVFDIADPPRYPLRVLFPVGKRGRTLLFILSLFFLFLLLFLLSFLVKRKRKRREEKN